MDKSYDDMIAEYGRKEREIGYKQAALDICNLIMDHVKNKFARHDALRTFGAIFEEVEKARKEGLHHERINNNRNNDK